MGADAALREARQFVRAPFNLASGPLLAPPFTSALTMILARARHSSDDF